MKKDFNNPAFKKLLQKLQEESWQLELLISGFAIFGLFSAYEPLKIAIKEAQNADNPYAGALYTFLIVSVLILLFNLMLHVTLRGLWIGALGLRYVSGDIDYDELKYAPKFTNYLKKKIGSFDKYIATLENYCSIIFAISFLLIFYVLAIAFTIITIVLVATYLVDNERVPEWVSKYIGGGLIVGIVIGMLITFIDFITQGLLKKNKWVAKVYFPIYWIFSFITLSFLYRPLVYNFLDNKFGRRISIFLVPVYILLLVVTSIENRQSNYFEKSSSSSAYVTSKNNYEDMLTDKGEFIRTAAIPSKVIKESYLKVFMPLNEAIEDRMFKRNEGLKPKKDKRGLHTDIVFSNNNIDFRKRDSLKKVYIKTFNTTYKVYIDSTQYESDFILGESSTDEFGFETFIDIKNLSEGKHLLTLRRDSFNEKDTTEITFSRIPFWHFKE